MGLRIDFGRTAADYAHYRAGFPAAFFERLQDLGPLATPRRALDLGSGTGLLAVELARRGHATVALDRSEELLAAAAEAALRDGVMLPLVRARAEALPFGPESFDLVSAATCWHWFDRQAAAAEAQRVLRGGGYLVICALDWHRASGGLVEATIELIAAHNPSWAAGSSHGFDPAFIEDAIAAGLEPAGIFSELVKIPYDHESWRGRIRASAGIGASLTAESVEAFDRAHAAMLSRRFPWEPLMVEHRMSAVVARKRAAGEGS
jgi:SAM-dependent methyltransferase